jgi:hypothetical protein
MSLQDSTMFEAVLTVFSTFSELVLFAVFALISSGVLGLSVEQFFHQKKAKGVGLLFVGCVMVYASAVCFMTFLVSPWSQVTPSYLVLFVQPVPILIEAAIVTTLVLAVVLRIEIKQERALK